MRSFSNDDKRMICAHIEEKFGSLRKFTEQLRLRLLLKPLGYAADLTVLRERCNAEVADLSAVGAFLTPRPDAEADATTKAPCGGRIALIIGDGCCTQNIIGGHGTHTSQPTQIK